MRTGRHKTSASQGAMFKECAKASKTKSASRGPNKIEAAIAKLIKRVTPKNRGSSPKLAQISNAPQTQIYIVDNSSQLSHLVVSQKFQENKLTRTLSTS